MAGSTKSVQGAKIITGKVRLSFPSVLSPDTKGKFASGQYKASLLWNTKDAAQLEDLKKMQVAVMATAVEAFGKTVKARNDKGELVDRPLKMSDIEHPFRKGDEKPDLDGYAGCVYINAKSKYRPGVIDAQKNPIENEGDIYGGCYVRASLVPLSYVQGKKQGVTFRLCNLQKIAEGEPFGARQAPAEEDFADSPAGSEDTPFEGGESEEDTLGF